MSLARAPISLAGGADGCTDQVYSSKGLDGQGASPELMKKTTSQMIDGTYSEIERVPQLSTPKRIMHAHLNHLTL